MRRGAEVLDQMLALVVVLGDDMARRLARDELTTARAGVLWSLRAGGPSTQRALADSLGVSARTVTGLVDGLVGTGFVTREAHPTDRRATLVTLTERATAVVQALEAEQDEFVDLLFGEMTDDVFDGFAAGLAHVVTRIRSQL
jgi:DNA-binding MarR family transcriptional regulator